MNESKKKRPEDLNQNSKWIVCRDCGKGIECIGNETQTGSPLQETKQVEEINFTESVTIKVYVTIKKTENNVIKFSYSDPERTKLIKEEKLG